MKETFFFSFCICSLAAFSLTLWLMQTGRGDSISPSRWLVSVVLSALVASYGVWRKSLDFAAGPVAFLVGYILTLADSSFCTSMIAFFLASSRLTKWRKGEKEKFEAKENGGIARDWSQVVCNGLAASIVSLCLLYSTGGGGGGLVLSPILIHTPTLCRLACLGAISCCCGDTWASEIGSVLGLRPILVTSLRPVPRGTNGGISLPGLIASAYGGVFIGTVYYATQLLSTHEYSLASQSTPQWIVIPLGLWGGLIGSLIDSILGATLQYSGYNEVTGVITHRPGDQVKHISGHNILSNNGVNLISSCATAILTPLVAVILA